MKVGHYKHGWGSGRSLFASVPTLQATEVMHQVIQNRWIFTNIIEKSNPRQGGFHHALRKALHDYLVGIEKLGADIRFIPPLPHVIETWPKNSIRRIKAVTIATGVFFDQFLSRERRSIAYLCGRLKRGFAFFCLFFTQVSLGTPHRFLQITKTHVMKRLGVGGKWGRDTGVIVILRTDGTEFRSLLGAAIDNEVTCSTAFFLHQLPTGVESISPRHRCFHHIVALIARCLHVFQWQHRTAPAYLLCIVDPEASLQLFHHMGGMLRCRRPLTFMTYCATNLIKRVWLDIRMNFIRLWDIRHFGILDPEMARHATISKS